MANSFTVDIPRFVNPLRSCDDSIREDVLAAVGAHDEGAVWIHVHGPYMSEVFSALPHHPGMTLVKVGEDMGKDQEPVYIARGWYNGSLLPAYCGLHISGAVVPADGRETKVRRYQVLLAKPGHYRWRSVTVSALTDVASAVCGGINRGAEVGQGSYTRIARWGTREGRWVCGHVAGGEVSPSGETTVDILVKDPALQKDPNPVLPNSKPDSHASVVVGRYSTTNHWSNVVRGAHYSSAFHFQPPLKNVPRILVGLSTLDMGDDARGATIRVDSFPQNVTTKGFICNGRTWMDTKLYNLNVDWAAIEETGWKCGVFSTTELGEPWEKADSVFDHRIAFPSAFTFPPMVFVCFNGVDMCGNWNLRTYATKIDHTGFNLSIVKSDDGDTSTRLWSAAITWIAIPVEDVLKRKSVWMGQFSTSRKGEIGSDGAWRGHVDFGFKFQRPPKVFMGLDHFSLSRRRNLRLSTETSNVTVSGMDWKISKWHDTVLKGASVSYLAIDCADQ